MADISKIKIGTVEYDLRDPNGLKVIPIATTTKYGVVRPDGETVFIDESGKLGVKPYELPNASRDVVGGIRIYYNQDNYSLYISNNGIDPF